MDGIALDYEQLTQRIVTWSQQEPDVRAAAIIGSRACSDHPADEWSDLDILLFVPNPEHFIRSAEWVANFGSVWLTFAERTPDGGAWSGTSYTKVAWMSILLSTRRSGWST